MREFIFMVVVIQVYVFVKIGSTIVCKLLIKVDKKKFNFEVYLRFGQKIQKEQHS